MQVPEGKVFYMEWSNFEVEPSLDEGERRRAYLDGEDRKREQQNPWAIQPSTSPGLGLQ